MHMDENLVLKAVEALQKYHTTKRAKKKPQLVEDNPLVSVVIALKKIPDRKLRPLCIPLPHSLYPADETEMCLITKNDKKSVKELLESKGVEGVTKIIPLKKLKTDFKSFEAKRQLSSIYDIFLADRRIYAMLPQLLGKAFFRKKKFPFPVDLQKKSLSEEIARARDSTYLHLGLGSCVTIPVARINYPASHLVENVISGMNTTATRIHQGWRNIQTVHLKSVDSIALPLFNSLPPAPTLLPGVKDGPVRKKIKLEEEAEEREEDSEMSESLKQGSRRAKRVKTPVMKKTKVTKVSAKKIKGSTVLSSRYEKALKKRRRKTVKSA